MATLMLLASLLLAVAHGGCQSQYAGPCNSDAPCCDSAWSCLRQTRGSCEPGQPIREEFRCGIAGGSAPPAVVQEEDEQIITPPLPSTDCVLVCPGRILSLSVSSGSPAPVVWSDVVGVQGLCEGQEPTLSRSSFSCRDVGSNQLLDVRLGNSVCSVPVEVSAAPHSLVCVEGATVELNAVGDHIYQPGEVAVHAGGCESELLFRPVMATCEQADQVVEVEVVYGSERLACPVRVVGGPQCATSEEDKK